VSSLKIIVLFLAIATVANIGLTLYLARPKAAVEDTTAVVRANTAMDEITRVRDDLARAKMSLANSINEIGRLKTEYATVVSRLANVTTPTMPAHSSVIPPTDSATSVAQRSGAESRGETVGLPDGGQPK
jgi:hypothetical protein